jgi:hypothetical protein
VSLEIGEAEIPVEQSVVAIQFRRPPYAMMRLSLCATILLHA